MAKKRLVIVGMGGHSKVVRDVAMVCGYEIEGYLDDKSPIDTSEYLGPIEKLPTLADGKREFFLAIGDNLVREKIDSTFCGLDLRYARLIHPSAIIGSDVDIEEGTLVMPGVIINAGSRVGKHVILNTASTIDHDCTIEEFSHISPGVHLAGAVYIRKGVHIGIGASVIPKVTVGEYSVIGAGAAVIRDIPAYSVAVGVPAKVIKKNLHN